ncbi:MAG: CPBP family intramembrane metalloprotease [Anaerolineales bacterium]|nr:CPBP family intramembrane metalloprotease [Anaerolineales bacterium]
MLERKPLAWFIILAFAISWPLFISPLLFTDLEPATRQIAIQGLWALGMWGPGIAALVATLAIEKQPFKSLRLNTLGPKRYYLWAWLLPPVLVILSGLLTVLIRTGQPDTEFTFMQQQMEQAGTQLPVSTGVLVLIQVAQALLLGPLINIIFAMGEELGWRGFLLPRLLPLGQWKALLISGLIWGIWHAPVIAQGHNYPDHPVLGILLMIVFCVLLGIIIGWMYLNTRSPWVAALAHGSINAWAGLPYLFLKPGFDTALGGTLTSLPGFLVMGLFVGWLVLTKRLPVWAQEEAGVAED